MTLIAIITLTVLVAAFGFVVAFGAPYVPSRRSDLKVAFSKLYKLKASDTVVDIGSGDGVVLREVCRRGARAVGFEINPFLYAVSRLLSRGDPNVQVRLINLWQADFPKETTVVYVFGEGRDIDRMGKKVQQQANRLNRELAFISYGFEVPGYVATKKAGAHYLYHIVPLQPREA